MKSLVAKVALAVAVVVTVVAVPLAVIFSADDGPKTTLERADEEFGKHNYKKALELYEVVLQSDRPLAARPRVEMKVIVCQHKLNQPDDAEKGARAFVAKYPNTIWEARGCHFLGNLLRALPHWGYRLGEVLTRGRHVEGGIYVPLHEKDNTEAIEFLEKAKALYYTLEKEGDLTPEDRASLPGEVIALNFDLAEALTGRGGRHYRRPLLERAAAEEGAEEKEHEVPTYDKWEQYRADGDAVDKILFLFGEVSTYDTSDDKHPSALALYREGMYLVQLNGLTYERGRRFQEELRAGKFKYVYKDPKKVFAALLQKYPKDELADAAAYSRARTYQNEGDYVTALKEYAAFVETYPKSKWVGDCKAAIQDIQWKRLTVTPQQQHAPPGKRVTLNVSSRNTKTIRFTAHKVKLEEVLLRESVLMSYRTSFSHFDRAFAGVEQREKVAEWELDTKDEGKHYWYNGTTELPLSARGAYIVEADGGEVTFTAPVIISDLTLVQKSDRARTIVFAADALTGQPVAGANVVVKERWYDSKPQEHRVHVHKGTTNDAGIFEAKFARAETGGSNSQIDVFAQAGEDRYAVNPHTYSPYWGRGQKEYRVYAYTDRPVYRPNQQVHFKVLLRIYENGTYETPKAGTAVHVQIRSPKGEQIYDREHLTGPFGSISGDIQLTEEPPLGEYSINVQIKGTRYGTRYAQGNRFRVEEYKKPEFEVAVNPASDQVKLGGKVKATVSAQYYFGAPVVEGTVQYKVFRRNWTYYYSPYDPYEWLYGRGYYWHGRWPWRRPQPTELVAEGEGVTDANGEYVIEVDTAKLVKDEPIAEAAHMKETDHIYTFEVDVVDQSRRHIQGTGEVKVTRNQFYAFLTARHGFYQPGERIEIEVNTLTPSNAPKTAKGTMKVYRLEWDDAKKARNRIDAYDEAFATDETGRGFFGWTPDEDGRFLFEFTTTDDWGKPVVGSRQVWVAGKDFHGRRYTFSNLEIITDKRVYKEGDTAHLMINTNFAGSAIFLSTEMESEIRSYRVLRLDGKSQVLDVRITRDHVPNFFMSAYLVHDGEVYGEMRELFVPPEREFITVKVTPDKDRYKPGETGTFTIETTDFLGHPVVAEASFGVTDESVYYIQGEYAPEIRKYFYGQRRRVNIPYTTSRYFSVSGREQSAQVRKRFRTHGMPPGWHGWYGGREFTEVYRYLGDYGLGLDQAEILFAFGGGPGRRGVMMKGGVAMEEAEGVTLAADEGGVVAPTAAREAKKADNAGNGGGGPQTVEPKVRQYFPDTAFWNPTVVTGPDGKATVELTFPDSLTTWRLTARAITEKSQVGQVTGKAITSKDLLVRMQAPRFFVERDEVVLSANVHNYLAKDKRVEVRLKIDGYQLEPRAKQVRTVTVPSNGEKRVDWRVRAVGEGFVTVTMLALTDEESDAMKMTFPVLIHGIEKTVTLNGDVNTRTKDTFTVKIPKAIKEGSGEVRISLSPSMAVAMMDALPYLVDYPYGCVEQTMSRFLPAVMVQKTLSDLGIDLEDLAERQAKLDVETRTERLHRKKQNPVFSRSELDQIVEQGLDRLYGFQNADGGWGWFHEGKSDPYMSAYVAMGLHLATEAGVSVDENRLERAYRFLGGVLEHQDLIHRKAYIGYVLSLRNGIEPPQLDDLYKVRDDLNNYSLALLALVYHNLGESEKATTICENLENWVRIDKKYQTASWGRRDNAYGWRWWWYWYNDDIETNAYILKAYVAIRSGHKLNPMIARWLIRNREGNRWHSTKNTATAIYGLTDYIIESGEFEPDYTVNVSFDGKVHKSVKVTKDNMFTFDNELVIAGDALGYGTKTITIERDGKGKLYHTTEVSYFSLEENIKGSGHEIHVERTYYKLAPKKMLKKDHKGREYTELTYERHELKQFETVESGQEIEVELTITADNNYEYLVFEDMKPAGCEPVELRSGRTYAGGLVANMELRDEKVVFFVGWLRQGEHTITYKIRAEIPGDFHVLPTKSYAMYAPKVRAISDELRMAIKDLEE